MTVSDFGQGNIGAASADQFSSEFGSLPINWLWYSGSNRELHLGFRDYIAEIEDLTLYVSDVALVFQGRSGDTSFVFTGVDTSWTDGETLDVSIARQD